MSLLLTVLSVVLLMILCWMIYQLAWGTPLWINLAVERLSFKMICSDPEALTILGVLDGSILDFHSGKLTDASPRHIERMRRLDREGLSLIRRYDPENLEGQKWITYKLMRWYFKQNLSGHHFNYHWITNAVFMGPYPVNHIFGVQIDLINFLCTYHQIKDRRSVRRYVKRLQLIEWKMQGLIESLQMREANGALPPRFVIEKSMGQVSQIIEKPAEENPLFLSFYEKLERLDQFSDNRKTKWLDKVLSVIQNDVIPAYRKLDAELARYLEMAPEQDGVWQLPGGKDYYAFLLKTHTTTDLSPDEIHQIGLDEVGKLTREIQCVLEKLGLPAKNPGDQLKKLMEDPQYHYTGVDPRAEIIRDYQAILDESNQRMPQVFHYGSLEQVVVQRLPEFREPDSPIAYAEAPAMDGSRPGMMWLNLRDPSNVYRWGMRTLAYHEGIPGHVYQMAQAQKLKGLPSFRRTYFFNAYVEGWALYAEQLVCELGLEDEMSNLGRLQALLWRATRLVVDTGIHVRQWTRQEAIDYMVEKTGLPERDVITEVERYVVMPGQACAYYVGYLKFRDLRKKAEAILGDAFNLPDFHDVLINNGGLPLVLLEKLVDDYIDKAAGWKTPAED